MRGAILVKAKLVIDPAHSLVLDQAQHQEPAAFIDPLDLSTFGGSISGPGFPRDLNCSLDSHDSFCRFRPGSRKLCSRIGKKD